MITVKRPARLFSFTDWSKTRPREPVPGDRLDVQVGELLQAVTTTQDALAEIRRDDGALRNNSVGREQLKPDLANELAQAVIDRANDLKLAAESAAISAMNADRTASLYAKDAESAAVAAAQYASAVNSMRAFMDYSVNVASKAAASTDVDATEAENWANYSKAQADNAIAAKDEALQWAEYLAGPVVDPAQAPEYIAESKFPHGYFYQPVDGAAAGLWSAKWWALQAMNIVGDFSIYYLGGWDHPPIPGEWNPDTGKPVPSPLPPGTMYFDTESGQMMVWDGTGYKPVTTLAPGFQARYVYTASAAQTEFSGADDNGIAPAAIGTSPSDVHVNGVRLIDGVDYAVDAEAATLTLAFPATAASMVQWDILVPPNTLPPGAINAYKIETLTPDGTATDFPLQYIDPDSGLPVDADVGSGAQLMVLLDGIVQEPGADYTATGATLHFLAAPSADAHLWSVWYQPGAAL